MNYSKGMKIKPSSFNTVEIDLAALQNNYRAVCQKVGAKVKVMVVVKSDAYGHGLVHTALALARAGAEIFGVAEVKEGIRLRQAGIKGEIVVLLGVSQDNFDAVFQHRLSPVVFDRENLHGLAKKAAKLEKRLDVHLKVDTGMGRLGILPEETESFVHEINDMEMVDVAGFMSHFPLADAPDAAPTLDQCHRFNEIVDTIPGLKGIGLDLHIANSAALLQYPETYLDMVRPGIILYGCAPDQRFVGEGMESFSPVMRFITRVIQIKEVPEGQGLSYGHIHITERPTRIAVLPVGYADGYLRCLSGKAEVLVHGQRVPVLGRICMNACMVDITDIDHIAVGDEVVLMGSQGDEQIHAEEIAQWMNTIDYEVLCLIGSKNQHIYRS